MSWLLGPRAYVWSFRDDPIARSARPRLHSPFPVRGHTLTHDGRDRLAGMSTITAE